MNHNDQPHSSPWEILPIWLYLVRPLALSLQRKTHKNLNPLTTHPPPDSPPLLLLRPPRLHPLPLQTHPPHPLPLQPLARSHLPRSAAIRLPANPPNNHTLTRRIEHPLTRRVQHGRLRGGGAAGALCERAGGGDDAGMCVKRGGGGGAGDVCVDDGAEGGICW